MGRIRTVQRKPQIGLQSRPQKTSNLPNKPPNPDRSPSSRLHFWTYLPYPCAASGRFAAKNVPESQSVLPLLSDLLYEARAAAQSLTDLTTGPHVRLGVTGLSRAGKTVFITALIEHLSKAASPAMRGRRNALPVFRVHAEGRLTGATLEPQPDDAVPRFAYEEHIAAL